MSGPIWDDGNDRVSYSTWQVFLFIRSGVIILLLIALELVLYLYPGVLGWIFRSLKIKSKSISSHGIVIRSDNDPVLADSPVQMFSSYCWALRSTMLSVCLYLWDSMVIESQKHLGDTIGDWNTIYYSCLWGAQCYALGSNNQLTGLLSSGFLRVLFVWDLQPVCDYFVQEGNLGTYREWQDRALRQRRIVCYTRLFQQTSWKQVFERVVVAMGIGMIGVLLFEGVTGALIQYTHRKFFNVRLIVWIVIVVLCVLWIYASVYEARFGIGDTAHYFILLAVVVIFFHADRLSSNLVESRTYQEQQALERLQKTELGAQLDEMLARDSSELEDSGGSRKRSKRERAQQLLTKLRKRIDRKQHSSEEASPQNSITNETPLLSSKET